MQSIKRDLSVGLSICALLFVCALAWGSPFVAASSGSNAAKTQEQPQQAQPLQEAQPQQQPDQAQPQPQPDQGQAQPNQAPAKTFTGTVLKKGSQYLLRDTSGQVFKLDDSESAKPYEGKAVKVVGQLDEQAMMIHVQSIEGTEA
ncbi:MAG: DUF5818 domain-containing protein [Terracidiphilus sp.]